MKRRRRNISLARCAFELFLVSALAFGTDFSVFSKKGVTIGVSSFYYFQPNETGTMSVENAINMPSDELPIEKATQIFKEFDYPKQHELKWVSGRDSPGYKPGYIPALPAMLFEMHDVVITTECVIIKPDGYHLFKKECHPRYWPDSNQSYHHSKIEFKKYDDVICIGHQHTSEWGHWFLEILPCFVVLPEYLIAKSVIAVPEIREYIVENLAIFGVERYQIIQGKNLPLFARNFYTVDTVWCGDLNVFLLMNMRNEFVRMLNLDKKPPFRFVIINREKGMARYMSNYDEIMKQVKTIYPQYPWEPVTMYKSLCDQGRYFNQILFLFAIHGSILANELFMQPNTICIELQMESWLLSFIHLGVLTGKIIIEGKDSRIKYYSTEPNEIEITYFLKMISAGIRQLKKLKK